MVSCIYRQKSQKSRQFEMKIKKNKMYALLLVMCVLVAKGDISTNNVGQIGRDEEGQAGESYLVGKASFTKMGAVAIPAGYEPVIMDVKWAEVFEVVEMAKHQMNQVLNHTKVTTEDTQKLADMEARCLRGIEGKVENIKSLVQHQDRTKRGFLELLGNLIGLGLGMSNRHLVHEVASRQETLQHTQVEQREILQKTRLETAKALEKLDQGHSVLVARDAISEVCHEVGQYVDRMIEAVYLAMEAKVTPSLLKPEDLMKLAKNVEANMKAQGLKTLESGAALILGAQTDVLLTDSMMRLLFLVPVIEKEEHVRELWRLNPVEIKRGNQIHRVRARHEFVAVSGGSLIAVTTAQLMSCPKVYGIHVCREGRIEERTAMSCISAVYTGDSAAMERLCEFQRVDSEKEHATELGGEHFYISSDKPLREQCGDSRRVRELSGDRVSVVGERCQVAGAGFEILRLPRPGSVMNFRPHIRFEEQQGVDHAIDGVKSLVSDQLVELEASIPKVNKLAQLGNDWWIYITVGLGIGAMVLGLCGACLVRGASKVWTSLRSRNAATDDKALEENCTKTFGECGPDRKVDMIENAVAEVLEPVLREVVTTRGETRALAPPPGRLGVVEEGEDVVARVLPRIIGSMI